MILHGHMEGMEGMEGCFTAPTDEGKAEDYGYIHLHSRLYTLHG